MAGGGTSDVGIGLTTAGQATTVESGGNLGILANVTNASTPAVTWSLASGRRPVRPPSTPPSDTYAVYAAPAAVASEFTVTITATAVANPARQASIQLTVHARVRPANAGKLAGQYAFLVQGFDVPTGRPSAVVGSFTADGYGRITGGAADFWFGASEAGSLSPLAGTYTVGDDNRATVTLGDAAGAVPALPFHAALGHFADGVAGKGGLVVGNPLAQGAPTLVLAGTFWRQDPAAFSLAALAGPYAFRFNGWNGTATRTAMGGTVTADAAGAFTGGVVDTMAFGGAPVLGTVWSGTCGAPSASGRAVLAAPALTGATGSAVLYAVAAGHWLALLCDAAGPGRVTSGELLGQAPPFALGTLDGTLAVLQTANYTQPGYGSMTAAYLSLAVADGAGALTLASVDENFGGNAYHGSGIAYTYTLAASGTATIYDGARDGGRWFCTGANQALMLGFDPGVSVGLIQPQAAGPFTAASLAGSYFAAQQPGASIGSTVAAGGVATATGDGRLTLTLDTNYDGAVYRGTTFTETVTVGADGMAYGTGGDADSVICLFSPDRFARFTRGTFYPCILLFER